MTTALIETLNGLQTDPTLVVNLYKQLFDATFFALVQEGTEKSLDTMQFLTYSTTDNIRELPLFTDDKFILQNLARDAKTIKLGGTQFWTRLLDIIETGKCEVAINAGQAHGIRLNKEMILGMIGMYGVNEDY
jgi:hypothetical protein